MDNISDLKALPSPTPEMRQKIQMTLEFLEDVGLIVPLNQLRAEWIRAGFYPVLYYLTFEPDLYRQKIATLVMTSGVVRTNSFLITAPEDDIAEAFRWVYKWNPHLQFMTDQGMQRLGYAYRDFETLEITAEVSFEKKII